MCSALECIYLGNKVTTFIIFMKEEKGTGKYGQPWSMNRGMCMVTNSYGCSSYFLFILATSVHLHLSNSEKSISITSSISVTFSGMAFTLGDVVVG